MAIAPTKGNLINLKKSLALAENGYELLDRKRNILVREMMRLIEDAEEIQRDIDESYEKAYKALQAANVSLGISAVRTAASVEKKAEAGSRRNQSRTDGATRPSPVSRASLRPKAYRPSRWPAPSI